MNLIRSFFKIFHPNDRVDLAIMGLNAAYKELAKCVASFEEEAKETQEQMDKLVAKKKDLVSAMVRAEKISSNIKKIVEVE